MEATPTDAYPVNVRFDQEQQLNQLWGIPFFGIAVRGILAIPHLIILWFYVIIVVLVSLITWYPVLTRGEYPSWGYEIIGGYIRWTTRVQAWITLMAAPYPPFSARPGNYPIEVDFPERQELNQLWGIPLFGVLARAILAIPHFIVIWLLDVLVTFLYLITWFPVLVSGRYPNWGYMLVGGTMRWTTRVQAYVFLMADAYPPFRLEE